jgi:hypothetical protein
MLPGNPFSAPRHGRHRWGGVPQMCHIGLHPRGTAFVFAITPSSYARNSLSHLVAIGVSIFHGCARCPAHAPSAGSQQQL